MTAVIKPKRGFNWGQVVWGKPNARRSEFCSLCIGKIDEDEIPLMMWKRDGSMAQFCEKCVDQWWTSDE